MPWLGVLSQGGPKFIEGAPPLFGVAIDAQVDELIEFRASPSVLNGCGGIPSLAQGCLDRSRSPYLGLAFSPWRKSHKKQQEYHKFKRPRFQGVWRPIVC